MAETALLEIENLHAWYGASHILHGISLHVNEGEVVALVGRNGAGKTTTLRAMMGLMPKATGHVRFAGRDLLPLRAHQRFHLGLAYVPEERRIVPGLSVRENLRLGLVAAGSDIEERAAIDEIAETFPRLKERLDQEGVTLSGGEQQMLAIARTLMGNPALLLLDEPSEGLAPIIVQRIGELLRQLRSIGSTVLIAEQNMHFCLGLASHATIIDKGQIVYAAGIDELKANDGIRRRYLAL